MEISDPEYCFQNHFSRCVNHTTVELNIFRHPQAKLRAVVLALKPSLAIAYEALVVRDQVISDTDFWNAHADAFDNEQTDRRNQVPGPPSDLALPEGSMESCLRPVEKIFFLQ